MAITAAKLMVEVDGDSRGAEQATARADSAVKGFASGAGSAMQAAVPASAALVGGVAAAGAAFGGLTVMATNWAGELEQNLGGSEAVFKEYAGTLQETARSAFSNMGLSTSDYLQTANKMGSLMLGAGFDTETAMNLSSAAMQRAADVASIMGIDASVAMESIAGAAKGNFTMMDNLGVAMNDTTLNAYALEKGLNKTTAEMTTAEKVGLAMEMFMDRTAFAAGNYAKENETFAGSFQTMKAAFKDTATGLAEDLLPALTNVFRGVTDFLTDDPLGKLRELAPVFAVVGGAILAGMVPALVAMAGAAWAAVAPLLPFLAIGAALGGLVYLLVERMGGWAATWDALKAAFGRVTEALAPVRDVFARLWANLAEQGGPIMERFKQLWADLQPVLQVVGAVIGGVVVTAFGLLTGVLGGVMGAFGGLVQAIQGALGIVVNIVKGFIGLVVGLFTGDFTMVQEAVQGVWDGIVNLFGGLWGAVSGFVTGFVDSVVGFFTGLWDELVGHSIVPDMIDGIVEWFGQLPGRVGAWVTDLVTKVVTWFTGLATTVLTTVGKFVSDVVQWVLDLHTKVTAKVTELVTSVLTWFGNLARDAVAAVGGLVGDVVTWFAGFGGKVLGAIAAFPSLLVNKGRELVTGLWNGAKAVWETVTGWVRGLGAGALSALGNLGSLLYSSGQSIIQGLWNGLKSVWSRVTSWFRSLTSAIPGWVKSALGIHSPSRVMMALGKQTMEGYALGLEDLLPDVSGAMKAAADAVSGQEFAVGGLKPVEVPGTMAGAVSRLTPGRGDSVAPWGQERGGDTYNITMPIEAGSIRDVADLLERVRGAAVSLRMGAEGAV